MGRYSGARSRCSVLTGVEDGPFCFRYASHYRFVVLNLLHHLFYAIGQECSRLDRLDCRAKMRAGG